MSDEEGSNYDCIVIGAGGVGSAALYFLARRGLRVLGLDRFAPPHDWGSSHGETRVIRLAYFEQPEYVPLLKRAYDLWEELESLRGRRLYHEVGLLQLGGAGGRVISGIQASARQHRLPVETLGAGEIPVRFPGFRVERDMVGILEKRAGVLEVEACVQAYLDLGVEQGAVLKEGLEVLSWRREGEGIRVDTDQGDFRAERLVVTAGAWASRLLRDLRIPLEVLRKSLFWFRCPDDTYGAERGCPAFLYELDGGSIYYGFPSFNQWGIKVAEHTGGTSVGDPLHVDRGIDSAELERVSRFVRRFLPAATTELLKHSICFYTMTPDGNFVVDRHPEHPQVVFAAGLSGHGYKLAPVLAEVLTDLTLEGRTEAAVDFLALNRPALSG